MITKDSARRIGRALGVNWKKVDCGEFRRGVTAEAEEHSDVIGKSKTKAGMIALAHLREMPDYYTRLDRMERAGKRKRK